MVRKTITATAVVSASCARLKTSLAARWRRTSTSAAAATDDLRHEQAAGREEVEAEDWIVGWRFWVLGALLVGVNYLVAMMVMTLDSYRRAARRVPQPVAVEMEEWDNHLVVRSDGSIRRLAYENIAAAVLTTGHLFIHAPPDVVIVPNGAFAQPGDPNDLAEKIMAFGREE